MSAPYAVDLLPSIRVVWEALSAELAAYSALTTALGGSGRVVIEGDAYPDVPAGVGLGAQWARLVIVPIIVGPTVDYHPGAGFRLPVMLRAEQPALDASGFKPAKLLERILHLAHQILDGWNPGVLGPAGSDRVRVTLPGYLVRAPQPAPLLDSARQLWFLSADYRLEVAAQR